jgi:hypothetical protein
MRLAILPLLASGCAFATCPPAGHDHDSLTALRESGFAVAEATTRDALSIELLECLDAPDPQLRDRIAYEGTGTWLRAGLVSLDARQQMLDVLLDKLGGPDTDPNGFRRPFAALSLSELARTDRVSAWLSDAQREALVAAATDYLQSVSDYRGFDDREGWRHGVAHASDLLLQLVLNPALSDDQTQRVLHAVATQIAPPGEHFYVFGEPERLARPFIYAALRKTRDLEGLQAWLEQVAQAAPLPNWQSAFDSRAGLARRHNVRAYLTAVYVTSRDAEDPALAALAPKALALIQGIP